MPICTILLPNEVLWFIVDLLIEVTVIVLKKQDYEVIMDSPKGKAHELSAEIWHKQHLNCEVSLQLYHYC